MGFYVSGVDAPKNCRECGHDLAAIANCVYTKRLVLPEEHDMSSGRHPLCPIFPVEMPHGRTIDADAFLELCNAYAVTPSDDEFCKRLEYALTRAATIIPAEPSEEQREYESAVEYAQYCEIYEPSYDPETGAL